MSINFFLLPTDYDILPVVFDAFPVEIKDDITYQRQDAWQHRNDADDVIKRLLIDDIGPTWSRGYTIDRVALYYTVDGGNVFQKEYFHQIKQIEDSLFSVQQYQTTYCQLDSDLSCLKSTSILRYFDGTFVNLSSVFYDPNFDNIQSVLYEASTNSATKDEFQYFLAKDSKLTPDSAISHITRTSFPLGWPLEGPENDTEKRKKVEDFLLLEFTSVLEVIREGTKDGLEISYISIILFENHVLPQALKDMMLAIGSLFFILIIMWIQTSSFWITGWALFSIVSGFWITNLLYRTIINYAYFGYFHVISIFIVLGIGADDIFVFYNTWKTSGYDHYPSLAHRMSDCYRRAAGTMFFTSFTTMMAFLVGGISPVLPLGSFGIFTGILIGVNYASVIIFFPNVLITHHKYFKNRCCPCCISCYSKDSRHDVKHKSEPKLGSSYKMDNRQETLSQSESNPNTSKKRHLMVRFFGGPYFNFVTHKVIRWFVILIPMAMVGFSIWAATRIETSSESVSDKIVDRKNKQIGGQTDEQTDKLTDKRIDRQAKKLTYRLTDIY